MKLCREASIIWLRNPRPVERISVANGELANEFALRAAAFTEGMNCIDLSQVVSAAISETLDVRASETSLLLELGKGLVEEGNNMLL